MTEHDQKNQLITDIRTWMTDTMAAKRWSAAEWAHKAGVAPSTIQRAVKEGYQFVTSTNTLTTLAEAAGVSAPKLTGDGPRTSVVVADARDGIVDIPEYDIRLSAGGGYYVDREEVIGNWPFPAAYLQQMRLSAKNLSMVEVSGDSMQPTLWDGDRVMIDHGATNPAQPGVYAIWDSNATVVKRVEKVPASDPVMLVLISDNKNHNQYTVLAEAVNIIGRVVWFARRM